MSQEPHILIIDARFYEAIADELFAGASAALLAAGASFDRISVPGVLEIPAALAMALKAAPSSYDGFVLLGCVIRGETGHYDIVAGQSARAIMDMTARNALALGSAVLTVESMEQAWARAKTTEKNKGAGAASAALALIALRGRLSSHQSADR